MPKLIPVPDELSKPFWDAVNEKRLILQHCGACDKLQYPPQQTCQVCNSAAKLTWKEVSGKGHIATYIVIEDGRLKHREDVREGLEQAPAALVDLYTGDNRGKLLIKIAESA